LKVGEHHWYNDRRILKSYLFYCILFGLECPTFESKEKEKIFISSLKSSYETMREVAKLTLLLYPVVGKLEKDKYRDINKYLTEEDLLFCRKIFEINSETTR
jgi:hypothetical protein